MNGLLVNGHWLSWVDVLAAAMSLAQLATVFLIVVTCVYLFADWALSA